MSGYTPEQTDQINWTARWAKYRIPIRFWDLGLPDYERTEYNLKAIEVAKEMVVNWRLHRPLGGDLPENRSRIGKGAIIIGPYGAGKSRLICAATTDIARRYNTSALYLPVANFFHLGRADPDRAAELKRLVERVPLLALDDVGTEYDSGSGYTGKELYRILRLRFDRALPTLATTNVPLAEWSEKYEPSMFSFLHEAFAAAVISGEDWRRARR